jgi:uncharacterized protein (TIGR02246 family)
MPANTPQDVHALLEAAANAGDLDAFVSVYTENATLVIPPDGPVVTGREAIRRALEPTFSGDTPARIEVIAALEGEQLALTHARWRLGELEGRGTIVSRKDPDGTWRIEVDNPVSPH